MGDMGSQNSPLICCNILGRAKKYNKFVVPFAWYEIGQWGCDRCYDDERYFERELCVDGEVELFTLSRSYKELKERLELEKINYMK